MVRFPFLDRFFPDANAPQIRYCASCGEANVAASGHLECGGPGLVVYR